MKHCKVVIFDVDGTLVDSIKAQASAWQDALREFGYDVSLDSILGQIDKDASELLRAFLSPEDVTRLGDQIVARRLAIFKREYLKTVRPFPRIRTLFKRLREDGHKIVLGASGEKEELDSYLKLVDVEDLIDGRTSADESGRTRPEILKASLAKVESAKPEHAIVIGASPHDAEVAREIGMIPVGILSGGFSEQELLQAGCVAVFDTPEAMLQRYDDLPLWTGIS